MPSIEFLPSHHSPRDPFQATGKSPFAVAVLSGNTKVAMRILHYTEGKADLSNCHLMDVPESVVRMAEANMITKLDISNNCINTLTKEFISKIKSFNVNGNPLDNVPPEFKEKYVGNKQYLTDQTQSTTLQQQKVIIIGAPSSGKSALYRVSIPRPFLFDFLLSSI